MIRFLIITIELKEKNVVLLMTWSIPELAIWSSFAFFGVGYIAIKEKISQRERNSSKLEATFV